MSHFFMLVSPCQYKADLRKKTLPYQKQYAGASNKLENLSS